MRRFFTLLLATLREIFDEAPYARFLAREHLATSPESYRRFLDEQRIIRERKPRCC
jgi:hypothetical protein